MWDDRHRPLPRGAGHVGEIVVRGVNTMRGYHNHPEATAEAFAGGGSTPATSATWTRTASSSSSTARRTSSSAAATTSTPGRSRRCSTPTRAWPRPPSSACPHELLGEEVKAYLELKAGALATEEELIAFAKERMAPHKYPRSIELRPSLPKLASGKIDKAALKSETQMRD